MPSGRKIRVNKSIHTPPLPVEILISTCEGIEEQIKNAILSFNNISDKLAGIDDIKASDIFWYLYVSLRSQAMQRHLFSLPKNGIHSISLIKQLTIDFLHKYYSAESMIEQNDHDLELKDSLRRVANEALADLKQKHQDEPIVHSSNVIQRNYQKQLWWIESQHLPSLQFQAPPVSSLEDEDFNKVLVSSAPVEPWERRLAQDSRNRRDVNHSPAKPKSAMDLFYGFFCKVRRKFEKQVLHQALIDRYQASFESLCRVNQGQSGIETAVKFQRDLDKLAENERIEHFFELIRSRVDTLYIENLAKGDEFSSVEFYNLFKKSGNVKYNDRKNEISSLKGSVHPSIRSKDSENELKEMSIWLVSDIRSRVTSNEFEILCNYSLTLLKQN
jgi:hypothetical protein